MTWLFENAWLFVGSISGSMVAMMGVRDLSFMGRLQSLMIGSLVGVFVGPSIVEIWFSGFDPASSRVPSAICFFTGASGVAVMPVIIKRFKAIASRVQIKVLTEKADD